MRGDQTLMSLPLLLSSANIVFSFPQKKHSRKVSISHSCPKSLLPCNGILQSSKNSPMAASSPKLSRNPPSPPLVLFLSPPKAAKPFFPQKQNLQLPLLHCSCQPSKNISPTTAPPTTTTLQQLLKSPSPSSWQSSKYLITA